MDIDVAASEVGRIKPHYPDYNIFDDFVAPIPRCPHIPVFISYWQKDKLPSNEDATESTNKKILDAVMENINLNTKILNTVTAFQKSRLQTNFPANSDITVEFPIENEDQLRMLEASLRDDKYKQQYTAKMVTCLQSGPKLSLKVMMHHVLKPEVGLKFTFQGTDKGKHCALCLL
nr:unnamed protein product [Trichobilharzia regenti]